MKAGVIKEYSTLRSLYLVLRWSHWLYSRNTMGFLSTHGCNIIGNDNFLPIIQTCSLSRFLSRSLSLSLTHARARQDRRETGGNTSSMSTTQQSLVVSHISSPTVCLRTVQTVLIHFTITNSLISPIGLGHLTSARGSSANPRWALWPQLHGGHSRHFSCGGGSLMSGKASRLNRKLKKKIKLCHNGKSEDPVGTSSSRETKIHCTLLQSASHSIYEELLKLWGTSDLLLICLRRTTKSLSRLFK